MYQKYFVAVLQFKVVYSGIEAIARDSEVGRCKTIARKRRTVTRDLFAKAKRSNPPITLCKRFSDGTSRRGRFGQVLSSSLQPTFFLNRLRFFSLLTNIMLDSVTATGICHIQSCQLFEKPSAISASSKVIVSLTSMELLPSLPSSYIVNNLFPLSFILAAAKASRYR